MVVLVHAAHQILHVVAAVIEPAFGGDGFSVNHFRGTDLGYFSQSDEYAFSVEIAKSAFDVILCV